MKKYIAIGLTALLCSNLAIAEDKPLPGDFQHRATPAPAVQTQASSNKANVEKPVEVSRAPRKKTDAGKPSRKSKAGKAATTRGEKALGKARAGKDKVVKTSRSKSKSRQSKHRKK